MRAQNRCIATRASVSSIETNAECLAFRRARPSPMGGRVPHPPSGQALKPVKLFGFFEGKVRYELIKYNVQLISEPL